jgi:hypothetical protein
MPKERADEFYDRFQALITEFNASNSEDEKDPVYGLMVIYYPTTHRVPKGKLMVNKDKQAQGNT